MNSNTKNLVTRLLDSIDSLSKVSREMTKWGKTDHVSAVFEVQDKARDLKEALSSLVDNDNHSQDGMFNAYQEKAMRTANDLDQDEQLLNAVLGLSGESGELTDIIKKYRFQGHPLGPLQLIDEAGDVLWYLALLASALDVPLEDIAKHNIQKLAQRYPHGFEAALSLDRQNLAIQLSDLDALEENKSDDS